jgi:hypothetical protein
MTHKIRPHEAVRLAKEWVESERKAQSKKAGQAEAEATTGATKFEVETS